MKFYFVTVGNKDEVEVIKELKPKRLLCSFHYFKNKDMNEFIKLLGYKPEIMLDSGAYSAYNSGKIIDINRYMDYVKRFKDVIEHYVCLDALGDSEKTFTNYWIMRDNGLRPLAVFHYQQDEKYLIRYLELGEKYICLGGTVPEKNKTKVSEWVRMLTWLYPEGDYHLLGSGSKKILDHCDIISADAATWIMMAINGHPEHLNGRTYEDKIKRMKYHMSEMMERYEG